MRPAIPTTNRRRLGLLLAASIPALAACGSQGSRCGAGTACGDAGADARAPGLHIEPSDSTLTVLNGAPASVQFRLYDTPAGGTPVEVPATWSLDSPGFGAIGDDGVFTASGHAGGVVHVTATPVPPRDGGASASTTLAIALHWEVLAVGAPSDAPTRFATTPTGDPARGPRVLYPLADARMPHNVAPPDVQWDGAEPGDWFHVSLRKPHAVVDGYVASSGAALARDWVVARQAWSALADSDPGEAIELGVDRWDAATSRVEPSTRIHTQLASGDLYGDIYYVALVTGNGVYDSRIYRVGPGSEFRTAVFDAGLTDLEHPSASPDGHYLRVVSGHWTGGTVFDLTTDLSVADPPRRYPSDYIFNPASFGPDSRNFVTDLGLDLDAVPPPGARRHDPGTPSLVVLDAATGADAPGVGLFETTVELPAWAPDDSAIAFVDRQPNSSDIVLAAQTAPLRFDAPVVLHAGAALAAAPEGGLRDFAPTWSPDARFVAFAHSASTLQGVATSPSALYLVPRTGGAPVRLARASEANGVPCASFPKFAPFVTHEPDGHAYLWLAFVSTQPYGNAPVGLGGTSGQQLWVTAIDLAAPAGQDPSSPPYWLPGQNPLAGNREPSWALSACRRTSESCRLDSDCCSGTCGPDPADPSIETCRPAARCRMQGEGCGQPSDCCAGLVCNGNVCDVPPPG